MPAQRVGGLLVEIVLPLAAWSGRDAAADPPNHDGSPRCTQSDPSAPAADTRTSRRGAFPEAENVSCTPWPRHRSRRPRSGTRGCSGLARHRRPDSIPRTRPRTPPTSTVSPTPSSRVKGVVDRFEEPERGRGIERRVAAGDSDSRGPKSECGRGVHVVSRVVADEIAPSGGTPSRASVRRYISGSGFAMPSSHE